MVFPGLQILIRINSQDFKLVVPDPLRHKRRSSKLVRNLLTGMAIRIIEKQEQIIGFRVVQSPFLAVRQRVREIRCRFSHPVFKSQFEQMSRTYFTYLIQNRSFQYSFQHIDIQRLIPHGRIRIIEILFIQTGKIDKHHTVDRRFVHHLLDRRRGHFCRNIFHHIDIIGSRLLRNLREMDQSSIRKIELIPIMFYQISGTFFRFRNDTGDRNHLKSTFFRVSSFRFLRLLAVAGAKD